MPHSPGWSRVCRASLWPLLGVCLLVAMPACTTRTSRGVARPAPGFSVALAGASLKLEAGAAGAVQVQVERREGLQDAVIFTGVDTPYGVVVQGSVPAGAGQGQFQVLVAAEVPCRSYPGLKVLAQAGGLTQEALFTLTVLPGKAYWSAERLQASGGTQKSASGTYQNAALVGEPVLASATEAGGSQVRHGFTPPLPVAVR